MLVVDSMAASGLRYEKRRRKWRTVNEFKKNKKPYTYMAVKSSYTLDVIALQLLS